MARLRDDQTGIAGADLAAAGVPDRPDRGGEDLRDLGVGTGHAIEAAHFPRMPRRRGPGNSAPLARQRNSFGKGTQLGATLRGEEQEGAAAVAVVAAATDQAHFLQVRDPAQRSGRGDL